MSHKFVRDAVLAGLAVPILGQTAVADTAEDNRFFSEAIYEWNENADDLCAKMDGSAPNADIAARVSKIFSIMAQSPSAQFLIDYGREHDVTYCYSQDYSNAATGIYYPDINTFVIDDNQRQKQEIDIAAHELRHMWQSMQGINTTTYYSPRNMVRVGKFKEADAEAYSNLVAYELKTAGEPLYQFDMPNFDYFEVKLAFNAAIGSGTKPEVSQAMRAAFEAWFDTPASTTVYENHYLTQYEYLVNEIRQHYPKSYGYKSLKNKDLSVIGQLPNGRNYFAGTGGVDMFDAEYSILGSKGGETRLANLYGLIDTKRSNFCAARPAKEASDCAPYPTAIATLP